MVSSLPRVETAPEALLLEFQTALAGRYSIVRELGRGGMGAVFLAHEVRLDRLVALKVLLPELASPSTRERFMQEARLAAGLAHPNIVAIHAVDEARDFVFFSMHYVDGESLANRLASRGSLSPLECSRILRDIGQALAYAHGARVTHRDIKADNILIERSTGRALLVDFGIARAGDTNLTGTGQLIGTPAYMSPEQASGEPVDGRSDLYALGVVGFVMLCGRLPFPGTNPIALLAQHLKDPAPRVSSIKPGLAPALARVIDRCLLKDPADRFQRGEEFITALDQAVEQPRELPPAIAEWLASVERLPFRYMLFAPVILYFLGDAVYPLLDTFFPPSAPFRPSEAMKPQWIGLTMVFAVPIAVYLVRRLVAVRRVLAAGYDRSDLVTALAQEAESQSARARERGSRPPTLRERMTLAVPGAVMSIVALLALGRCYEAGDKDAMPDLLFYSWLSLLGGALASRSSATMPAEILDLKSRLRVWQSPLGRFVAFLGRLRLRQRPVRDAATHQPTELALGGAANALFEALPREIRKELAAVPEAVRALESRAQRIRARLVALSGIEEQAEPVGQRTPGSLERHTVLQADIRLEGDRLHMRLGDIVSALEAIRVDLLRLRAGTIGATAVSVDLESAERVCVAIDALVAGHDQVARLLLVTPTP